MIADASGDPAPRPDVPSRDAAVLHVVTQGNLANRMIQYMAASRIAAEVPGCMISNVFLPEWGIAHPALPITEGASRRVDGQEIDVASLSHALNTREIRRVDLWAYCQWFDNFPSLKQCSGLFPSDKNSFPGFGPGDLVCNIRGGETLDARHPHYTLLPLDYYADLAARTGLKLVFMGQIENNIYCNDLRARFPGAVIHPSQGAIADFQTFRNSVNLVPAISTFSWLAAWLSEASTIHFPISGHFNPAQCPDVDLLPIDDDRYSFTLFPINLSIPVENYRVLHQRLAGTWRLVDRSVAREIKRGPRWPVRVEHYRHMFDETFYLKTYPDIQQAVQTGLVTSGLSHFLQHGVYEHRLAFDFDPRWYSSEYPMAALEVGQRDFADLMHHYVEIGCRRGYKPLPPGA